MKKSAIFILAVVFVLGCALPGFAQITPEITIEVAHMFPEGDPSFIAVNEGKDFIEKKSNGRVTFTIYPNGTYGDQNNSVLAVRMGTLDVMNEAFNSNYIEDAGAIQGPFLFSDYEHWRRFKESDYCKSLIEQIEQTAGYHVMGVGHFGFRQFLGTQPAKTVDEFSKLKMRVVDSPAYKAVATVLGATGIPINITDVYLSLQTNVVQGTENPLSQLVSMKFYEVAKYLAITNHMIAQQYWVASNNLYNRLTTEDKALLDETFEFIANRIEEIVEEREAANIELMKENGVEVVTPDHDQFRARLNIVFESFPHWEEIYKVVQGI